jgi:phenylpropionate dioxygenase-like ring-hydroxylating dioxygenase large terminal subunit|nr:Rieske 2Fe-2S domain-containing protein [Kofleriaceae bacterium]
MRPLPLASVPKANPLRYFHPVLATSALAKKPVQVQVAGTKYVLFRDAEGRPAALADTCPHRGAPLSGGRVLADGRIACPYHGWSFDRDGGGRCPSQPTLRCETPAFQVAEKYGHLWLAEHTTSLGTLPSLGSAGFEFVGGISTLFDTSLEILLDNFAEDEHITMVHSVFGWSIEQWDQVAFEATNFDDRTEVVYSGPQRHVPGVMALMGLTRHDGFHNQWTTRFDPVRFEFQFRWHEPHSKRERPTAINLCVIMVPETATTTRHYTFMHTRLSPRLHRLRPIVDKVFRFLTAREVKADADFLKSIPLDWTPTGARLDKYDKPLVHNRKLLRERYWGHAAGTGDSSEPSCSVETR